MIRMPRVPQEQAQRMAWYLAQGYTEQQTGKVLGYSRFVVAKSMRILDEYGIEAFYVDPAEVTPPPPEHRELTAEEIALGKTVSTDEWLRRYRPQAGATLRGGDSKAAGIRMETPAGKCAAAVQGAGADAFEDSVGEATA